MKVGFILLYSIPDSKKTCIVKTHIFSTVSIIVGTKKIMYTIYFVNDDGNPLC